MSLIEHPTLSTKFHLSPDQILTCDKYYILYWQASHLWSVTSIHATIVKDKIEYIPIWNDPVSMQWASMNPEKTIRLSFRRARGFKIGYVIIQLAPVKEKMS